MIKTPKRPTTFSIAVTKEDYNILQERTKNIKRKYKLTKASVMRKVLIELLDNDDFLDYIGVIKDGKKV